jgi:hypothetical protein
MRSRRGRLQASGLGLQEAFAGTRGPRPEAQPVTNRERPPGGEGRRAARWGGAWALLLALGAAGCGNWSNEDIAFVEALPGSQALKVSLPAQAGQALCAPPGPSEIWGWAKPTGDAFNSAVDFLLGLVDLVKGYEPTTRKPDYRVWGPFADSKHPGNEIRVVMTRAWEGGTPSYSYAFEARTARGEFQAVIGGTFTGGTARTGRGDLTIHYGALRALGMNDGDSDPQGDLRIEYDRTADPRTVSFSLSADDRGFGLAGFDYGYAGYSSGKGLFHYKLLFASGYYLVDASFDETGAGRAIVEAHLDVLPDQIFAFDECWDAASCVTNVNDPRAGDPGFPDGVSKLCPGGVCPLGQCPAALPAVE